MKFTINLATRRYLNTRLLNWILLAALLLLGGFCILNVREAALNQAELAKLRNLHQSGKRTGGPTVTKGQIDALAGKVSFANALIDQKAVDWLALLDHLEEVVPPRVALSQVEPPKREQGVLIIAGSARSFADLRALLENMEHSKNFSEVYLLTQSETNVGQTQRGVNFTISCKVAYR